MAYKLGGRAYPKCYGIMAFIVCFLYMQHSSDDTFQCEYIEPKQFLRKLLNGTLLICCFFFLLQHFGSVKRHFQYDISRVYQVAVVVIKTSNLNRDHQLELHKLSIVLWLFSTFSHTIAIVINFLSKYFIELYMVGWLAW